MSKWLKRLKLLDKELMYGHIKRYRLSAATSVGFMHHRKAPGIDR